MIECKRRKPTQHDFSAPKLQRARTGKRPCLPVHVPRTAGELKMAGGWQPIETAPRDGSIVWTASSFSMCPSYFYVGAWRNWYKGPRYENVSLGNAAFAPEEIWFEPTHWQPLPEPPLDTEKATTGKPGGNEAASDDRLGTHHSGTLSSTFPLEGRSR